MRESEVLLAQASKLLGRLDVRNGVRLSDGDPVPLMTDLSHAQVLAAMAQAEALDDIREELACLRADLATLLSKY